MAGRIRTIKPEYWTSEQVAELSMPARLLFIGLWNFADDGGNHPASPKTLKMEVFPGDDITADGVQTLINEIIAQGLIQPYTAHDGRQYWHVSGWHHQRIDRPNCRHPKPNFDDHSTNNQRTLDETPPNNPLPIDPVRECKGKGKEGKEPSASNTRAREAAPAESENQKNPETSLDGISQSPLPVGEGPGVGLNDFAETYQAIAAWGESDTGHTQIVAWKKITGYRDSQHGPTTDELAKFVSYHLDPKRRDAFLAAPIEYFCEKFPGWLTNAKTMNRKPRGRPPAPNQPSPRSTTGNARTLEPTAIAHILHHTAP